MTFVSRARDKTLEISQQLPETFSFFHVSSDSRKKELVSISKTLSSNTKLNTLEKKSTCYHCPFTYYITKAYVYDISCQTLSFFFCQIRHFTHTYYPRLSMHKFKIQFLTKTPVELEYDFIFPFNIYLMQISHPMY